jgi:nucleoside-diphosphate-sugar epimerase
MKKAAVIGANRFVGFCLCDYLLKEGIEVSGYIHKAHSNETMLQEEMKMLLDRNANFKVSLIENTEALFDSMDEVDAIYFTYFDQGDFQDVSFFREKMKEAHQVLIKCISHCLQTETKLILLSSMRVFGAEQHQIGEDIEPKPDHSEGRLFLHLERMVTRFSREQLSYVIVRIPTVYGPWQPLAASYQQACLQQEEKREEKILIGEDRRDVLFIDDVVAFLAQCQKQPFSLLHCLSGKTNQWENGADLLRIAYESRQEEGGLSLQQKESLFPFQTELKEGIRKQRLHTRNLLLKQHFR